MIAPALFAGIINHHNQCLVSGDRLKVKGDQFEYVACLASADQAPPARKKAAAAGGRP